VFEEVADEFGLGWHFGASLTGNFIYLSSRGEQPLSIFSLDRKGNMKRLYAMEGARYGTPRFSPDGGDPVRERKLGAETEHHGDVLTELLRRITPQSLPRQIGTLGAPTEHLLVTSDKSRANRPSLLVIDQRKLLAINA
jgi:hypothetical protein